MSVPHHIYLPLALFISFLLQHLGPVLLPFANLWLNALAFFVLLALIPATLTYHHLETVVRRAPSLVSSNRRTAFAMLA